MLTSPNYFLHKTVLILKDEKEVLVSWAKFSSISNIFPNTYNAKFHVMIKKLEHQNITFIFNNKTNIKNRKIYKIQILNKYINWRVAQIKETKAVRKSYHSILSSILEALFQRFHHPLKVRAFCEYCNDKPPVNKQSLTHSQTFYRTDVLTKENTCDGVLLVKFYSRYAALLTKDSVFLWI